MTDGIASCVRNEIPAVLAVKTVVKLCAVSVFSALSRASGRSYSVKKFLITEPCARTSALFGKQLKALVWSSFS